MGVGVVIKQFVDELIGEGRLGQVKMAVFVIEDPAWTEPFAWV